MIKVPRVFLNTVLKGCVSWAKENNVTLITEKEIEIIQDKRSKEKDRKKFMNQDKISKLIKDLRKKNNLTQNEFAKEFNVTYQAVSKWENGKNLPDINVLKEICDKYNLNINDFLEGKSVKNNNKRNKIIVILIMIILLLISVFLLF